MEKRIIPVFATEAEEAKWWYDNREALADDMVAAMHNGRPGEGAKARWERLQRDRTANPSSLHEDLSARKAS
jgi:hypothetical protein